MPKTRRQMTRGWTAVRRGLSLYRYGLVAQILLFAASYAWAPICYLLAIPFAVMLAGQILCLRGPGSGKALVIGSLLIQALGIVITTLLIFSPFLLLEIMTPAMTVFGALGPGSVYAGFLFLALGGPLLFLLYARKMAQARERLDLARRFLEVLWVPGLGFALAVACVKSLPSMAQVVVPIAEITLGLLMVWALVVWSSTLEQLVEACPAE